MSSKTETMNKKNKRTFTPRLRFPEFRDAGKWKKGQCSDIAYVWQGYGFPDRYQGQPTGKYPFYKVSDISAAVEHGSQLIDHAQNYIDETVLKKLKAKPVPAGTIVFAKIGEAIRKDRRALTTRSAVIDNNVAGVKAITGKMTDDFLFYLWTNVSLIDFAGGVVPAVSKTVIENIPVSYPEEDEQHPIAECLGSLDELIAAEGRKLEALRDHKRGLMQQLFPQPGQTQPRLRFPEFRGKGEWGEKTLGKLSIIIRGGSPRPIDSYLTKNSSGLNWLKIGDVDKDAKYIDSTEEKVIPEALSKTREVKPGDFILSNSMSFGRPYLLKMRTCIHDGWIAVTNITESIHHEYLYYAIMSPRSQLFFEDQAAGGGVRNLNKDIIKSLPVGYPKITEQQKIADCLTSLDDRVAAQAAKIDALKTHKRGLMQQLFPAPEVS
jgi:type I restriction enzyme, S subunit